MTFCALNNNLDPLFCSCLLSCGNSSQPIVFCLFASSASLWRILKAFVAKKSLLPCAPNKIRITINAYDGFVLKLGLFGNCGSHPILANRKIDLRHFGFLRNELHAGLF
jgi:hypothetical protein